MKKIEIIKPDDFHVHLRQDQLLQMTVSLCSHSFARALVMPNTIPPVASAGTLEKYRSDICEINRDFTPLMTFKLLKTLSPDNIIEMRAAGAIAGKLYPAGSTTNSADGIKSWREIRSLLKVMSDTGMILSIHGEDPSVFSLDREKAYIPQIIEISEEFPDLKIVFEHLSSKEGIEAVEKGADNLAGSITVQHILLTLDDIIGGSLDPHCFCKPVLKRPEDREQIQRVILDGNSKFFFGSDSAPHLIEGKLRGSAGSFTSPVALPLLVQFFDEHGKLDLLENFVSKYGAEFYGLPVNEERITIEKTSWKVPEEYNGVTPLFAGKKLNWKIN